MRYRGTDPLCDGGGRGVHCRWLAGQCPLHAPRVVGSMTLDEQIALVHAQRMKADAPVYRDAMGPEFGACACHGVLLCPGVRKPVAAPAQVERVRVTTDPAFPVQARWEAYFKLYGSIEAAQAAADAALPYAEPSP